MTTTNPPAGQAGSYRVGDLDLNRIGYGAMQLAGPGVFGPPRDHAAAIELLRTAVELGVNHIDTADAYGPSITNEIIREALFPYDDVHLVTKVGIVRDEQGGWLPGNSPQSRGTPGTTPARNSPEKNHRDAASRLSWPPQRHIAVAAGSQGTVVGGISGSCAPDRAGGKAGRGSHPAAGRCGADAAAEARNPVLGESATLA
jgi:aldo/keto reductase family protein